MALEDFTSIQKELQEWRSTMYNVNKSEDRHLTVLRELNKLGVSISESLIASKRITSKVCDNSRRYETGYENSLRVGRESVKPLVLIKQTATELFADVKKYNNKELEEKFNFEHLYTELELSERKQARSQEFLKYLKMSAEGLYDIFSDKDKGKRQLSDAETVSSLSNRTDPSTLAFSLFENSATNAATSSPLNN